MICPRCGKIVWNGDNLIYCDYCGFILAASEKVGETFLSSGDIFLVNGEKLECPEVEKPVEILLVQNPW